MTNPLLTMSGIDKHFPGVQALKESGLEVQPGEVHVLLGENGAGNSPGELDSVRLGHIVQH